MRVAGLAAALLAVPVAAHAAETKVAVVAVGNDPASVGSLQRSLEVRLRAMPQLSILNAADIAPQIAVRVMPSATLDPAAQKKASDLIEAASRAYYEDKLVDALDKLAVASALYERTARVPTADRVRLLLWRTAVMLALNDRDRAEAEARGALVLSPDLKVDVNVFRPSVGKLVDDIRGRGLPSGTLLLSGLPPGAEVRVDDRLVQGERVSVPHGRHRVAIRAAGFHEVERTVDVGGDTAVPLGLPLALDPALDRIVTAAVMRGDMGDRDRLEKLVDRLDVDVVVVAGTRTEPTETRGLLFYAKGNPVPAGPFAAQDAMVDWAARTLIASMPEPAATRTPVAVVSTPRPTPRPTAQPRTRGRGLPIAATGGFAFVSRERDVSGGGGYTSGFVGVGPRVRAEVGSLGLVGLLDASFVTYGFSELDVNLPDGSRTTVDGGSTLDARVGGGYRVGLRGRDPDGPTVTVSASAFFESHIGKDLKDSNGALGIFPSQQRVGLEVRAGGRAPVGPVFLIGELGAVPFTQWSESPSNTTGESPKPTIAPIWRFGASWSARPGLEIGAEYAGELRGASFSGQSQAPLEPPIQDAKVTETLHGFTVSVRKSF